jgi:hypothetical protein
MVTKKISFAWRKVRTRSEKTPARAKTTGSRLDSEEKLRMAAL